MENISNEGGGSYILGVTNQKPRKIVGVSQKPDIDSDKKDLRDWIGMRVEIHEIMTPSGELVLSYIVGPRPLGRPVSCRGRFRIRAGSHNRDMTLDEINRIFNEGKTDYSSNLIDGADLSVFCPKLIEKFRRGWIKKKSKDTISSVIPSWSLEHLLEAGGLTVEGKPTYAGLILAGTEKSLEEYLPQSELIFEYRDRDGSIRYTDQSTIRRGFLEAADEV